MISAFLPKPLAAETGGLFLSVFVFFCYGNNTLSENNMLATKEKSAGTKREKAISLIRKGIDGQVDVRTIKGGGTTITVITMISHKQKETQDDRFPKPTRKNRNELIKEAEAQFCGRGDEDSEKWIRLIKSSRNFSKEKTYNFS